MRFMRRPSGSADEVDNIGGAHVLTLRSAARVREIDRQLYRVRLSRLGARWIILPGVAVIGLMTAERVASAWSAITLEHVIGGLLLIVTSATGYIAARRDSQQRRKSLEQERAVLLRGTSGD
jgi:hypothetical protein